MRQRPSEFWAATPMEFWALFEDLFGEKSDDVPMLRDELEELMERFPDGNDT